jgi:hypothetical protein
MLEAKMLAPFQIAIDIGHCQAELNTFLHIAT